MTMHRLLLLLTTTTALLVGCGGGGGEAPTPTPTPTPASPGLYAGTFVTVPTLEEMRLLVLESGRFYLLVGSSDAVGVFSPSFLVEGPNVLNSPAFVQTSGGSTASTFTPPSNIAGTYTANSFIGNTRESQFQGSIVAPSVFNYATPATLSQVIGPWMGSILGGNSPTPFTIAATGAIAGSTRFDFTVPGLPSVDCPFTGVISPRETGKSIFNVSLTYVGPAMCPFGGLVTTGIAILVNLNNGSQQLQVTTVSTTTGQSTGLYAQRQ